MKSRFDQRWRNPDGMLLMEVLLVVVILSVSLMVIIGSMTASLRGIGYVGDYTQAALLLDGKLSEALWDKEAVLDGDGTFDPPNERFRYSVRREDFEGPRKDMKDALKQVHVAVSWKSGRKGRKIAADVLAPDRDL